jgi:hypothetical protein
MNELNAKKVFFSFVRAIQNSDKIVFYEMKLKWTREEYFIGFLLAELRIGT